jgi:hypothetical protein
MSHVQPSEVLRCVSAITFLQRTCSQTQADSQTNVEHFDMFVSQKLQQTKLVCRKLTEVTLLVSLSHSLLQKVMVETQSAAMNWFF